MTENVATGLPSVGRLHAQRQAFVGPFIRPLEWFVGPSDLLRPLLATYILGLEHIVIPVGIMAQSLGIVGTIIRRPGEHPGLW